MGTDIFNTKRDSKFEYATTSAFVQSSSGVHCRGRHELQRGTSSPLCTALLRRAAKKFPEFLWLKKCDNWFNMIEEWPSWSWNKKLASLADQFMRFCPTIWRWDTSVRGLFRVVSASRWRTEPHIACCAAIPRRQKIPVITQPPYSLDLAPGDSLLFPILKMFLKGTRFAPWRT